MFRRLRGDKRRRADEAAEDVGVEAVDDGNGNGNDGDDGQRDVREDTAAEPEEAGHEAAEPLAARPDGPYDETDVPDDGVDRLDLGGLRLLVPDGGQIQLEVTGDGTVLPTVFVGDGALQVSAFAAPRRSGIWAEVRAEIAGSLGEGGGSAAEADGPFGTELRAAVPVQSPEGEVVLQPARFVGVDGPRWFLRGLLTGAAAVDEAAAAPLEDAFRGTVVVRGRDAMAPRDPILVQVPRDVLEAAGMPAEDAEQFQPFDRGPEITEVR